MSLYKRPGSAHYWCGFTLGHRRIQQSTGTADRAQAEEYEQRLRARVWREVKLGERSGTFEQAVARWNRERRVKPSTAHRDAEITGWFLQAMAKLPLSAINREVIEAARRKLEETRAPTTVNRYMAVLRAILRAAVRWDWIRYAPPIETPEPRLVEPRFITRAQFTRLLKELPAHLRAIATFAVLTGLRTANVRDLTWDRVDLDRAHAWIPSMSTKGGRSIGVPLSAEAVELLRSIERVEGQPRVFLYQGRPISGSFGKRAWRHACQRAGVEGYRFHDVRHTWASWMRQDGVPAHALQALGGWASSKMVDRYAHLSPDHLREFAAKAKLRA